MRHFRLCLSFFFFNDTATTEIYTLSLHDALPIYTPVRVAVAKGANRLIILPTGYACATHAPPIGAVANVLHAWRDRKSTRLNSSHQIISYAVFCLKKKNTLQGCSC